jgi:hypothetical protein
MSSRKKKEVSEEESEESEEAEEESYDVELKVISIKQERYNQKKKRTEYLVEWENRSVSWEPKENLVDEDGTENIELIRYDIRKDFEKNFVPTVTPNTNSTYICLCYLNLVSSF